MLVILSISGVTFVWSESPISVLKSFAWSEPSMGNLARKDLVGTESVIGESRFTHCSSSYAHVSASSVVHSAVGFTLFVCEFTGSGRFPSLTNPPLPPVAIVAHSACFTIISSPVRLVTVTSLLAPFLSLIALASPSLHLLSSPPLQLCLDRVETPELLRSSVCLTELCVSLSLLHLCLFCVVTSVEPIEPPPPSPTQYVMFLTLWLGMVSTISGNSFASGPRLLYGSDQSKVSLQPYVSLHLHCHTSSNNSDTTYVTSFLLHRVETLQGSDYLLGFGLSAESSIVKHSFKAKSPQKICLRFDIVFVNCRKSP
ncbi:hypothetical protein Bca4012_064239 [Brassica carinata]